MREFKRSSILYLILIMAAIFSLGGIDVPPVQAQQEELDTIMARATAKGFLITLTRPDLSGMMDFYLLDTIREDNITTTLPAATRYKMSSSEWISDVTYQVKAILGPGGQEIAVYAGKYDGRWLVEGIDLLDAPLSGPATTGLGEVTGTTARGKVTPVSNNAAGKLVFQTQSGGDIYIINTDGTELRRITHGIDPQLSPDGTRIAFTRWEPRYELFTINIDGSGEQAWTHNWRQMKSPTWSADGSKLVFSYQDGGRLDPEEVRINVVRAFNLGERIKVPSDCGRVERTGKYLKCTRPADTYWHLKQIDLNTGEFLDLGTDNYAYGPTWHPTDPSLLTYKGQKGLALHNIQTNLSQPLTNDTRDHTPIISPDGSKLAISYWQEGHWEIHTMNVDGSNRQRLTRTPLSTLVDNVEPVKEFIYGQERFVPGENPHWNNAAPAWSPDGSQIAFLTDRTGRWEIWIMNADGSNPHPMFPNGALDGIALNYAGVDERMLSWR